MPEDKNGNGQTPTVEELKTQIENLNKGIASYRDTAGKSEATSKMAATEAKAAREEVERLKKVIEEAALPDADNKTKKAKLNPEDEERLKAWAEQNGFVTKVELDQERAKQFNEGIKNVEKQAIDEFLEKYPEYEKDENWDKIKEQFNLYRQPTSITGYRQLLTKIHKELKGQDDITERARAQEETRKRLGLGGGSQGGTDTDTTMDDLRDRYPNLSEDQIRTRLEEINQLMSSRKAKKK